MYCMMVLECISLRPHACCVYLRVQQHTSKLTSAACAGTSAEGLAEARWNCVNNAFSALEGVYFGRRQACKAQSGQSPGQAASGELHRLLMHPPRLHRYQAASGCCADFVELLLSSDPYQLTLHTMCRRG